MAASTEPPCKKQRRQDSIAAASVLVKDLSALYQHARDEERDCAHRTTDCQIHVGDSVFYAHSQILLARSAFFEKALLLGMREATEKVIRLEHAGRDVPKESVLALLEFIYTGRFSDMSSPSAWGLLQLLGGSSETEDFLGLSDGQALRQECTSSIMGALGPDGIPEAICQAHRLGSCASNLKQLLLENLAFHSEKLFEHAGEELAKLDTIPGLVVEVLKLTRVKPAWRPQWCVGIYLPVELKLSSMYPGLDNSAAAVSDRDMETGAGNNYADPSWIQAIFDRPIHARHIWLGIGSMGQDWDHRNLNGCQIQYLNISGNWSTIMQADVPRAGEVFMLSLEQRVTASEWRLYRTDSEYTGVSFWGLSE